MALLTDAPSKDRVRIGEQYRWNLAEIYPELAAWRTRKDEIKAAMPRIAGFAGSLGSSPSALAEALELRSDLDKELTRLGVYAGMLSDEDTRLSGPHGMHQEMQQLYAEFGALAAYIQPEILRISRETIERFIATEPRLAPYAFFLRDTIRRAAHTLSDSEEKILADAQPLAGSAQNIYGILSNADFPYPTITTTDGRTVKIDQSGYAELRTSPERKDREAAMSAFFTALGRFGRTFGTTMNSNVQKALFYAKTRKYGSALEASLDGPNIPVSVYLRLI